MCRLPNVENVNIDEILQLPEDQRAKLAGVLLTSLPAVLGDSDDGVAEAKRRQKELREDRRHYIKDIL